MTRSKVARAEERPRLVLYLRASFSASICGLGRALSKQESGVGEIERSQLNRRAADKIIIFVIKSAGPTR